ncbi:hypothetical protein EsDP_00002049 [Epichloe bromicola]|uniref:SHSP domain-containing protein n=1 Tax=Epichloe bromicola TaxID=79588 RepID=A0ABQ0CJM3_9HYPO
MSPQDQQQQQQQHPGFWDFVSGFGGAQNRAPGQGVDHQNAPPFPQFSGAFPFGGGGMHHGPPPRPHQSHHPPQPPHHGLHGGPPPPPPPQAGPRVGHSPWDPGYDWSDYWFNYGYDDDDEHGHESRREKRRERRESRRQGRRHRRHGEEGTDEEGNRSGRDQEEPEKATDKGHEKNKGPSRDTVKANADMPDPDEVAPEDEGGEYPPPYGWDSGGCRGRGRGRGGFAAGRGMHHRGRHCPRGSASGNGFDLPAMMRGLVNHPFFQNMRDQAERYRSGVNTQTNDADSFAPPVDMFSTERAFVVHVALPGARKEDVGVDWNTDSNTLGISGVVHRLGDEDLIRGLVSGERRVGLFERDITLPPPGMTTDKEDVDGSSITAKMEDGVLVVTVPKMDRGWTEIRKVDIQ